MACPRAAENVESPGTPYYISPEQIEIEPIDERSDVYALGIMIYEIIIGKRPYPEDNLLKRMDLHVEEDIPDPWDEDPNIPKDLRNFILKACSRDKEERYRDMGEILEQMEPLKVRFDLNRTAKLNDKKKMISVFLFSNNKQHFELNRLLEEFGSRSEDLGIKMKITIFSDF